MDIKTIIDELNRRHSVGTESGDDRLYLDAAELIEALQAKNKRLKDDLIEYGRHAAGCSQEFAKKYRCRCGWDKVEQALKET